MEHSEALKQAIPYQSDAKTGGLCLAVKLIPQTKFGLLPSKCLEFIFKCKHKAEFLLKYIVYIY